MAMFCKVAAKPHSRRRFAGYEQNDYEQNRTIAIMIPFSIRVLNADDLPLARQLFDLWRHGDNVTSPPATDQTLRRLLERDDFHVVAVLRDGQLIGGLTAYELEMYTEDATELFIYEVGVEETHRKQGVGRALIEFTRELCRSRRLSAMYVPAYANDARAVAFYEACGLKREDVAWFIEEFGQSS
jgi:aminoglycoside 3-N-acetyltransferase I